MNRFAQKVVSGGLAAGLSVAVAVSASAQAARSGAWTLNAPEGEWHMTGRDYSLQRFSPLKQITTSNVAELRPVWSFSTGTLRGHEGNPLVVGDRGAEFEYFGDDAEYADPADPDSIAAAGTPAPARQPGKLRGP